MSKNNGVVNWITNIDYCNVFVICTDVQLIVWTKQTIAIKREVSEEALKEGDVMNRIIPLTIGAWIMYCSMVGSYDGAIAILSVYLLLVFIDPFYTRNKKGTTAANSRTQK